MRLFSYKVHPGAPALLGLGMFLTLAITGGAGADGPWPSSPADFTSQREQMVETQIRARGISDQKVLAAMTRVERHRFVPEPFRREAYLDQPLPIGAGQTISQPYIVALMTELLELTGKKKILEVGTGSGYQAAVLAEMGAEVYTIEIIPSLAASAATALRENGYKNVRVRTGDGYRGWPEAAPFDGIIVTAAPDHVPEPLLQQLKEGGRLVIPVGTGFQKLKKIRKQAGKIEMVDVLPVRFVPLTGPGASK
jgi:protein-L-isoaspartate(D-aspartate) O-methyltransferase